MLISVLMSIYNENENEIKKSVESILNQTFHDFEFIIVIDNPSMYYVENILKSYNDDRLICLKNESNIGLAMSMNRAASIAKGKYIARMDADDISDLNRFQEEYTYLESHPNIGLVCTNYHYIDENNNTVNFESINVNFKSYKKLLPYINMIHHPTVMIRKQVFDHVGGYRNFPCTQDYDLWLRLLHENIEFAKIEKDLLAYRIRENSTWKSNGMKQQMMFFYIKKLYKERKKNNTDSYSIENLNKYLLMYDVTKKGVESYKIGKEMILTAKENLKNKELIKCFFNLIFGLKRSKFLRKEIRNKLILYSIMRLVK